ncbi:probable 2-oxoglutarate dehydrogenase E1 component DHKTD1, mitochondrial [Galendromus occidentalis]|uniref:Probable 2-oxoglutarate dehydrogenase E1 component DHKTD1, mitochondrial n=1 Tax=Galendromus occidentalis TaxID=34638 RepID=A0AAJ6QMX7_9ACAR|nr:probable 2-oxoglutarate dehydrogenase E1 component DHKTD1, mitochondrial [Galendromus occidentalis]
MFRQRAVYFKAYRSYCTSKRLNEDDARIQRLATAIRQHGHRHANVNPLGSVKATLQEPAAEKIEPEDFGLSRDTLLDYAGQTGTVDEWYKRMLAIYGGNIGLEFMHLDRTRRDWFIKSLERDLYLSATPTKEFQKQILRALLESQNFDHFVANKFATTKRYGGEGAESMQAFFLQLFLQAPISGITDLIIATPHRGRLNLLTGLLNFPVETVFRKMRGLPEYETFKHPSATGDVLSHLFTSTEVQGNLRVSLLPNPSHLEASAPMAVGKARARLQQLLGNDRYSSLCNSTDYHNSWVLPLQIHGDASFAGQGVIMETLLLSGLPHFKTGGSLHLIVNNQVGYTTPTMLGKSSFYNSDVMKTIGAPILHVNGDHPEAVCTVAQLALDYRQCFGGDVLVDMWCFRRWGHNEMDDPTFTNPVMYREIRSRGSVPDLYASRLVAEGVVTEAEVENLLESHSRILNDGFKRLEITQAQSQCFNGRWKSMGTAPRDALLTVDTGFPKDVLQYIGLKSVETPESFKVHPHLRKVVINERTRKFTEGQKLDWAMAELLAFGSLLYQGYNVRLCGQDVGRGTFSQRHIELVDNDTEDRIITLNNLRPDQGFLEVANSPLSEEAVMAFEYGFSLESPENLVIWEAQFGDFHNSAQVVLDTLITSGERKWLLQSGVIILLPHGMDGAGPEHSSCRIERFLQMCDSNEQDMPDSEDVNFRFVNPTTSAQYFHLIRRQMLTNFRKPLIVASPKLILRLDGASSSLEEMATGTSFQTVLTSREDSDRSAVRRIILCNGKHYFALESKRKIKKRNDVAIVRLEQLCPLPVARIAETLSTYPNMKEVVWAQEEHQNQGAWSFINPRIRNFLNIQMLYRGRGPLGVPAVGVGAVHAAEAESILESAFE